ncbi:MAG: hypothetical protein H0V60_01090 [Actinobacteria bacterium]|nr:hypothetical protein [Actinomycetota bacterium]
MILGNFIGSTGSSGGCPWQSCEHDADFISGRAGEDGLLGNKKNDRIKGGSGKDTLLGGPGADSMSGGGNNDALSGSSGSDRNDGGRGRDSCRSPGAGTSGARRCEFNASRRPSALLERLSTMAGWTP